ncbi:MAG: hypothetical protein Q9226_006461 [Calogaya cf. arnoldii]
MKATTSGQASLLKTIGKPASHFLLGLIPPRLSPDLDSVAPKIINFSSFSMALARQAGEKMERSDSGFADSQIGSQPTTHARYSSIGSSTKGIFTKSHAGEQRASTPGSTRPRRPQRPRPSTSHHTTSRQSSISTHGPRSHPSSRCSSFIVQDPGTQSTIAPHLLNVSRTLPHSRPETTNPYIFHRECQSLFDPPGRDSEDPPANRGHSLHIPITPREDITTPQSPNLSIPPTTIDWTHSPTRRREYEKIEASTRGIRGLWRRLAPKRYQKNSRLAFYDGDPEKLEDDSDAGSVRRYRVSLDDETIDTDTKENEREDDEKKPSKGTIRGWRRFGRKCP